MLCFERFLRLWGLVKAGGLGLRFVFMSLPLGSVCVGARYPGPLGCSQSTRIVVPVAAPFRDPYQDGGRGDPVKDADAWVEHLLTQRVRS